MIQSSVYKHGGLLALFALITTAIVAATHLLTREKIAEQIQTQRLALLNTVLPREYYDNNLSQSCIVVDEPILGGKQRIYLATKQGKINAFAIETRSKKGYSGNIDMILGVDKQGIVTGVRVLKHKETPGLGDKIDIAVSDWILSFNGQYYENSNKESWKVKKDGGQFDQFTGATITPRAVVNTLASTLEWLANNQNSLTENINFCDETSNG